MTFLNDDKLELRKPVPPPDAEDDNLQYDPHLQEETLRFWAKQKPSPEVCTQDGLVDVIAKLDAKAKVPDEIQDSYVIGKLDDFQIVTGAVAPQNIKKVREQREVWSLKAALPVHLHLFNSVPAIRCDPTSLNAAARENGKRYPGLDGSDVIIGIVDFGCDFRHQNFRRSDGTTRILFLWDQQEQSDAAPSPKPFNYGRELTADMIDRALAAGDESAYRVLSYAPPIAAHGTHVMDIAAGNGREPALFNGKPDLLPNQTSAPGVAPRAQIIFVNLRSSERGFLGNSRGLLDAVAYIFKKAEELGKPAVVNLSLSTTGGPHDGTTPVEQGFEALVTAKAGRAIVTSAGNAFTMRSHLSGEVSRASGRKILWQTDPRNTDPEYGAKNEFEIWYPKGKTLNVTLYAPGEDKTPLDSVALGETRDLYAGDRRIGHISHREKDPNNEDNHIDIRLPHLEDEKFSSLPWTIELSSGALKNGVPFHAWIEQSERGLSRFEGDVEPTVTLGSISCGNGTLTVGAFDTSQKAALSPPYDATSAGPIRETDKNKNKTLRAKPELSAPGVNVIAARAQGGVTALSGTSMAAPHVTGLIALLFQLAYVSGRGMLSFSKVCDLFKQGVQPLPVIRRPNPDKVNYPNHDLRLGNGRIDGPLAITALMGSMLRSFALEIKLSEKDIRAFVDSNPDFAALFKFLNTHTRLSGTSDLTVNEFVGFFEEQVGKNEFFKITMESLGERKALS